MHEVMAIAPPILIGTPGVTRRRLVYCRADIQEQTRDMHPGQTTRLAFEGDLGPELVAPERLMYVQHRTYRTGKSAARHWEALFIGIENSAPETDGLLKREVARVNECRALGGWAKTGESLADASMIPASEATESIATKRAMRVVDREVMGIWLSNPGRDSVRTGHLVRIRVSFCEQTVADRSTRTRLRQGSPAGCHCDFRAVKPLAARSSPRRWRQVRFPRILSVSTFCHAGRCLSGYVPYPAGAGSGNEPDSVPSPGPSRGSRRRLRG